MQHETVINAADYLSKQSVQYLFIATLIVLGVFGWLVVRWLVNENAKSRQEYQASIHDHNKSMEQICDKQNDTQMKLAVVLDNNTRALEARTDSLEKNTKTMDELIGELREARR